MKIKLISQTVVLICRICNTPITNLIKIMQTMIKERMNKHLNLDIPDFNQNCQLKKLKLIN